MRVIPLAIVLCVGVACGSRPDIGPNDELNLSYPGELVSPGVLGIDFVMRQHVVGYRDGEVLGSFEAVLEKVGDTLTLVALLPATGEAFALEQHGVETRFEARVEAELPVPPEFILMDVNRTFFMSVSTTVLPDGEHTVDNDGEHISELWEGGRLRERLFSRLDGAPAGVISIQYVAGYSPTSMPTEIVLNNGWFGYRLQIRTLSVDYLESADSDSP